MAAIDPFSQIPRLYHFTDSRNVRSIQDMGGIHSRASLLEMGVDFRSGGNDWSLGADERFGMDRYVHLCLRLDHPMEYLARKDGRILTTTWIRIDRGILERDGVMYSDGVSNASDTRVFTIEEAVELDLIDFEVLFEWTDWRDPGVRARLDRAKKCEVLVPGYVPLEYLSF